MRFSFATIMDDPKPFFDLTEFPIVKFPVKAHLLVYNPNYYPLPIVSSVRAFVGNSDILFASGEVTGAILMPRKITRLEVNFMTTSNLFEPNLKLAAYTMDVCGLIQSHSKSVVNSRVHAYTKVGYFGIGIPMKDIYIPDITFLCPLIQQSTAEIILKVADDLLPYIEQFNGVWNDEEMKDRLEYYKF